MWCKYWNANNTSFTSNSSNTSRASNASKSIILMIITIANIIILLLLIVIINFMMMNAGRVISLQGVQSQYNSNLFFYIYLLFFYVLFISLSLSSLPSILWWWSWQSDQVARSAVTIWLPVNWIESHECQKPPDHIRETGRSGKTLIFALENRKSEKIEKQDDHKKLWSLSFPKYNRIDTPPTRKIAKPSQHKDLSICYMVFPNFLYVFVKVVISCPLPTQTWFIDFTY